MRGNQRCGCNGMFCNHGIVKNQSVDGKRWDVMHQPIRLKKIVKKKVVGRGWHGEPCDLKQTVDAMTEHSWF